MALQTFGKKEYKKCLIYSTQGLIYFHNFFFVFLNHFFMSKKVLEQKKFA